MCWRPLPAPGSLCPFLMDRRPPLLWYQLPRDFCLRKSTAVGDHKPVFGPRERLLYIKPERTLRAINTCALLNAELKLEKKMRIRVEPGIFEWTKWEAGKTHPTLMTPDELREANFNVSTDYRYAAVTLAAAGFSGSG